jgi:hypothetical protein
MFNPETERLLGCDRLRKPTHTPEWDWYWQLSRRHQTIVRNDCFGGTLELDVAAGENAMTCDELGSALVSACEVIRDRETVSGYGDTVRVQDLVGPDEICQWLQVERNTLIQWRRRPAVRFPEPMFELSKTPIWARVDVEKWALDTGRLIVESDEPF